MLSQSEENYIKAIYHLSKDGNSTVSTKGIAENLQMKPASVTDMIGKLSNKGFANYEKYKGVSLSNEGKTKALEIIRKHRLWEYFLVEKLDFAWDEVHDIAEQLEHIKSPELTHRLDKFLNFPDFDPHGDPIPKADGTIQQLEKAVLNELPVGYKSTICGLGTSEDSFLKYLSESKIKLGSSIEVIKINSFDLSMEVNLNGETNLHLSEMVANNIFVKK